MVFDKLTYRSPHMKQKDRATTPMSMSMSLHVVKLCQVLQYFGSGRMPSLLFSRAVSSNPCWRLDGEIEWKHPLEHSVPAWLLALFDQPAAPSKREIHNAWGCPFLEIQYVEGFQYYALVPHPHKHQNMTCTAQEYTALLFDAVAIVVHAFPDMYAETGWEETEDQLEQVIKSLYPLFALEHKYKFLKLLQTMESV